jgi:hypothetical protein
MRTITGLFFSILLLVTISSAQDKYNFYGGPGGGFSKGLGFYTGDFTIDGGLDVFHNKFFGEGEVGWDSANLQIFDAGRTLRVHGFVMYQAREHWWFGGGAHYARVLSEPTDPLQKLWPVASAMYQKGRFRINNEYLFSVGNLFMTGPLIDMRYRIGKGFYYRERFGLFFYHDRNSVTPPPFYRGGEADFGVIYVIRDHPAVPQ